MLRKICSLRVVALSCMILGAVYAFFYIIELQSEPRQAYNKNKLSGGDRPKLQLQELKQGIVPGVLSSASDAAEIHTENDRQRYLEGLKLHSFNEYLSSRLSLHRTLPDLRSQQCLNTEYNRDSLPQATVVITFYNEATSTLLRTISSVVARSPPKLLPQVILIDDSSSDPMLRKPLEEYIEHTFKGVVTIIRNRKREGLIRSRMIGANFALAQVLIFLDSHVEVNVGWLEPLLTRLDASPRSVILPFIDIIDSDSFEYRESPSVRGGFNWGLRFTWEPIPAAFLENHDDYVPSPTMAGGLLAVNKNYFFKMGGYDEEMKIWGGENIEMSFRTWMCGGNIVIAMCSRVGHVFRDKRPYTSPDGENTFLQNSLRLAKVWMDQYASRFLATAGLTDKSLDTINVEAREQLRAKLSCNDFSWYLTHIYNPDTSMKRLRKQSKPTGGVETKAVIGTKLQDFSSGLCISTMHVDVMQAVAGDIVVIQQCAISHTWLAPPSSYGSMQLSSTQLCLDVLRERPLVLKCDPTIASQAWGLKALNGRNVLYHRGSGLCMSLSIKSKPGDRIQMGLCDKSMTISYYQS